MTNELPLVLFTIAAQMSAGSFIVLGLVHLFGARRPQRALDRITDPALYAIGPLLVLGLAASTFHLGSPLRAANALRHLGTSWLSREILLGLLFAAFGFLFAVLQWRKLGSHRVRQVVALVTAALGVGLVACISQVYSLRTVPAWATPHTPLSFFITTFLLGGLAVGAALVMTRAVRARRGEELVEADRVDETALFEGTITGIALGSLVALGLKFVSYPAYIGYLGSHPDAAAQRSLRVLTETHEVWTAMSSLLVFVGVLLMAVLLYRLATGKGRTELPWLALGAFVLVLAGEVVGRMLFYASMVHTGSFGG
ncbi:DmsC/YnfH family molybdoenzyme membrane anchor subunit [uncultured Tessaracoccus sp.]|uniref:dimethyl sulfoxide reductase anchor subunit family protein n=1 Tax=uncultured Tessaracoccus sp. TaxID=905023 RepID=UPI0025DC1AB9|nr:DmsC/YnfH family molybdoenzyme membrane anchor subunit [uncultured Tessaracoccus sp.]